MRESKKQNMKKGMIVLMVTSLVTLVSCLLFGMGIRAENILMVYVFGIMVIIIETKGYVWGTISSILFVFIFNFLFTEPIYTFRVNDTNYLVSLAIFLIVATIVNSLTVKLQRQMQISVESQNMTDNLYQISSGYLNISGLENVIQYGIKSLRLVRVSRYILFIRQNKEQPLVAYGDTDCENQEEVEKAAAWCAVNVTPCGMGSAFFDQLPYIFMPVLSNGKMLGVLAIHVLEKEIKERDQKLIQGVLSQIAVALEREFLTIKEQEVRLYSERERLRNNLLRSISHDLRTPLAGITGSASFLMESYELLDNETRNSLLSDIVGDSVWLGNMVDNLLNMTRIQEGRLSLRLQLEVVDDVISEMMSRVKVRAGARQIQVKLPKELLLVPMDGQLMVQVLVNLVDNAVKHTSANGVIQVHVYIKRGKETEEVGRNQNEIYACFEVIDDGEGIDPSILPAMFDSFVTADHEIHGQNKGIGIGLSICKAIIKAHGGHIGASNNADGGATVSVILPMERKESSNE